MSIVITSADEQAAWAEKRLPGTQRLRDGVWSVAIPCPQFGIRYTYCYLLLGDSGRFVIVDPGMDTPEGRSLLIGALESAGVALPGLEGVVITHAHADHILMTRWLIDQTGAWAGMHPLESEMVERSREATHAFLYEREQEWLRRSGAPLDVQERFFRSADMRRYAPNTRSTRDLHDGSLLPLPGRRIQVKSTPGHTPGHVCLIDHDSRAVLTGDHVLPLISPNVGLTSSAPPDRDSVAEYAWSLRRARDWDEYEVFPAHQFRFRGLAARCDELLEHQRNRQDEVDAVLDEDPAASPWDVAVRLTWSRPWESLDDNNLRAALAETMAHVRHSSRTR
jgi:glyoxylase-like metal-dependent hydrolase (beta-lactamase superfamily II)